MLTQRTLTDATFDFYAVIDSHGWVQLAPFHYDRAAGVLERPVRLADGRIVHLRVEQSGNTSRPSFLLLQAEGDPVFPTDLAELDAITRRMLAFDWDLHDFYELVRDEPGYDWVEPAGAGRMLRSPTVWEDLVKTLLTTNTTWRQTRLMCERLVTLGDAAPYGYAFPTPAQVAAVEAEALTAHLRCGYRGAYLHKLAASIADGALDVEAWASGDVDSHTLYQRVTALPGFGDYAAASILRLLGHHDYLSVDSVARDAFARWHNGGERTKDVILREHYERYGRWRGLVMWMDVLRDEDETA
jgi:N-glycosylase/DNA lyase